MKKSIVLILILVFIQTINLVEAQNEYLKKVYTNKEGKELPYRIIYPLNYNKEVKYPLVLVLHGAGERGSDNESQLVHGSKLFLDSLNRSKFPAIVVFPQCAENLYWSTIKIDRSENPYKLDITYEEKASWPLQSALDLVKQLSKEESVDKDRVYIMGLSMGGMGTIEAISRKPKLFAAAVPICGAGDPGYCEKYAHKLPIWFFHGAKDRVVDVKYSRLLVEKLKSLHADVRYSEYPDVDHNSWDNAFSDPELLPWMFSKIKK
jgi:predicted peptidase